MVINNLINKFGYSEMYEWSELFEYNIVPFGRFVTFDESNPGRIRLANKNDFIIGITTINSTITSDDPDEWNGKYICNEFGDILLQQKDVIKGENRYDNELEMPYVSTIKDIEVVPIINKEYSNETYIKRSNRQEWVRVNILGKCIVVDNGKCISGQYCTVGDNGIAVPYTYGQNKYYIIDRLTENTIMIFFK